MSKKIDRQFCCSKMMLPEHRSGLRDNAARNRLHEENNRPELDEQQRERLQQTFEQALAERQTLLVTIITKAGRKTFTGTPLRSDPASGIIIFSSGSASARPQAIKAGDILRLEPNDFL